MCWNLSGLRGHMSANFILLNRADAQTQQGTFPSGLVGFFFSFRLLILLLMVRLFQTDPQTGAAISVGLNLLLLVVVVFHSIGPAPVRLASAIKSSSFPLGAVLFSVLRVQFILEFYCIASCGLHLLVCVGC